MAPSQFWQQPHWWPDPLGPMDLPPVGSRTNAHLRVLVFKTPLRSAKFMASHPSGPTFSRFGCREETEKKTRNHICNIKRTTRLHSSRLQKSGFPILRRTTRRCVVTKAALPFQTQHAGSSFPERTLALVTTWSGSLDIRCPCSSTCGRLVKTNVGCPPRKNLWRNFAWLIYELTPTDFDVRSPERLTVSDIWFWSVTPQNKKGVCQRPPPPDLRCRKFGSEIVPLGTTSVAKCAEADDSELELWCFEPWKPDAMVVLEREVRAHNVPRPRCLVSRFSPRVTHLARLWSGADAVATSLQQKRPLLQKE